MLEATDLKNGTTFLLGNTPYKVEKYRHQKIARGGGKVKLTLRNLKSGDSENKTLNSSVKVEEISTVKKSMKYLYKSSDSLFFMDEETYEQVEIRLSMFGESVAYLNEGQEVDVLFWIEDGGRDRLLSVDLPPKVVLEIKDTAPGVRGDTATNVFKSAILENDIKIKVPLFVEKGDLVVVDTQSGEYIERAKG